MHKIKVDVIGIQRLQRRCDALLNDMMPGVVKLGRDPNFFSGDTTILDALPDLVLVAIGKSGIDVAVPSLQGCFDRLTDLLLIAF